MTGQDTTASAIAWMVKYLSENQKVLNALKVRPYMHLLHKMMLAGRILCEKACIYFCPFLFSKQAEQLNLVEKTSRRSFLTLEDLNQMPYASKVNL